METEAVTGTTAGPFIRPALDAGEKSCSTVKGIGSPSGKKDPMNNEEHWPGPYAPLPADHPLVRDKFECVCCNEIFKEGDVIALIPDQPADAEERHKMLEGRAYVTSATPAHWKCYESWTRQLEAENERLQTAYRNTADVVKARVEDYNRLLKENEHWQSEADRWKERYRRKRAENISRIVCYEGRLEDKDCELELTRNRIDDLENAIRYHFGRIPEGMTATRAQYFDDLANDITGEEP